MSCTLYDVLLLNNAYTMFFLQLLYNTISYANNMIIFTKQIQLLKSQRLAHLNKSSKANNMMISVV